MNGRELIAKILSAGATHQVLVHIGDGTCLEITGASLLPVDGYYGVTGLESFEHVVLEAKPSQHEFKLDKPIPKP